MMVNSSRYMTPILEDFDLKAERVSLIYDRTKLGLANSSVGIVDNEGQTRLEINYGLNDQTFANNIRMAGSSAGKRFIRPIQPQYGQICDLVLQLQSPKVYRKERHAEGEGYQIPEEAIRKVIDATKSNTFVYVFLQNLGSSVSAKGDFQTHVDVVFSKEDKEEEVRKSWEQVLKR